MRKFIFGTFAQFWLFYDILKITVAILGNALYNITDI